MTTNKPILIMFLILFTVSSCIKFKPADSKTTPTNALERAKKNVKEGRGASIGGLLGNRRTNYEFSTSNPMWRASLETLDFLPLSNVDYSGGVIITDWYNDGAGSSEQIKITLRFLSNEIRSDSIKIIVHKKKCSATNNCYVNILNNSKINSELLSAIVKKAALFEKEKKKK